MIKVIVKYIVLVTFLSWIIIGVSGFLWGFVVFDLLCKDVDRHKHMMLIVFLGLCGLTVYAEIFSLVYKVGTMALSGVLAADGLIFLKKQKEIINTIYKWKQEISVWYLLGIMISLVLVLPLASSYVYNYDTNLYHAQCIRWIEEYGAVRGLGNLHSRIAFNSSFLCLQALFSFKKIVGISLHGLNGFIAWIMLSYSVCSMKFWNRKRLFISDFLKAAIAYFINTVSNEFGSPGTDFFAHILSMYIVTEWISETEDEECTTEFQGTLCVLCIYAITLKLSAAMLVLFAVMPAVQLIKKKNWCGIVLYLVSGAVVLIPFFVRNIIISGYLIYPYEKIDLFNVDWKLPADICQNERISTKDWSIQGAGEAVSGSSIFVWFSFWKAAQKSSVIYLLAVSSFSCLINMFYGFMQGVRLKKWEFFTACTVTTCCLVFWFVSAPHIRFGRPYLLLPVFLLLGIVFSKVKINWKYISCFMLIMLLAVPLYGIFKSARAEERHFVFPADYDETPVTVITIGDARFYRPAEGDLAGYYEFPAVNGIESFEQIEMRGDSIYDGFRMKKN